MYMVLNCALTVSSIQSVRHFYQTGWLEETEFLCANYIIVA